MSIGSISSSPVTAQPQAKLPATSAGTQPQDAKPHHHHHGGGKGENALTAASLTSSTSNSVLDTLA